MEQNISPMSVKEIIVLTSLVLVVINTYISCSSFRGVGLVDAKHSADTAKRNALTKAIIRRHLASQCDVRRWTDGHSPL